MGVCIYCSSRVPSSNLIEYKDIGDEEEISWTARQTINNKVMLQTVSGSLLTHLKVLEFYVVHDTYMQRSRLKAFDKL